MSAILNASPASSSRQAAAEMLKTREYVLLAPRAKLNILRGLIELALASDVLREHINARVDVLAVPLRALASAGVSLATSDDGAVRRAVDGLVRPVEPSGLAEGEEPDFWIRWMDSCK